MRARRARLLVALGLSASAGACQLGKDSVVFATNTSFGVDLDASPPTTSIAYTRSEAVLAPTFEQNQVLPVMTSVGTKTRGWDLGAAHTFATGDAALIMSDALAKPEYSSEGSLGIAKRDVRLPAGVILTDTASEDRRPFFFGTHTNIGLAVIWQANVPDSLSFGMKRKELAYVPLIESEFEYTDTDGRPRTATGVQMSSLIATADVGAKVKTQSDTGVRIGQLFATGRAATYLSSHAEVRSVLGSSIIPNYDEVKSAWIATADEDRRVGALEVAAAIFGELRNLAGVDPKAGDLVAELNRLAPPAAYEFDGFQAKEPVPDGFEYALEVDAAQRAGSPVPTGGAAPFEAFLSYRNAAIEARAAVEAALKVARIDPKQLDYAAAGLKDGQGKAAAEGTVVAALELQSSKLDSIRGRLFEQAIATDALVRAVDYYMTRDRR